MLPAPHICCPSLQVLEDAGFTFYDERLNATMACDGGGHWRYPYRDTQAGAAVGGFLECLALCNTAIPEASAPELLVSGSR